jgi:hypothetical protein
MHCGVTSAGYPSVVAAVATNNVTRATPSVTVAPALEPAPFQDVPVLPVVNVTSLEPVDVVINAMGERVVSVPVATELDKAIVPLNASRSLLLPIDVTLKLLCGLVVHPRVPPKTLDPAGTKFVMV